MAIALYKKQDGEVICEVFADADAADAAMRKGWKDNPADAAEPKRAKKAKPDANEA